MYPGSWKFKKSEGSDFWEISCTGGNGNWRKLKRLIFEKFHVPGVMKIQENWIVWFLRNFKYRGSWKSEKIEASNFWEFSCTVGNGNWRKLKRLIFVKFHVPEVMKIQEKWSIWFLRNFMYRGNGNWWKLKRLSFQRWIDPDFSLASEKFIKTFESGSK